MVEKIPGDIQKDLEKACALHLRAVSDYEKCVEFSSLMIELFARLEDAGCYKTADKVMSILLNCNPKNGAHCDKTALVGEKVRKI